MDQRFETLGLRLCGLAGCLVAAQLLAPPAIEAYRIRGLPATNPRAQTAQTVGITEITVAYSRPAVRGREIWGAAVPWGRVWRAGANENTVVSFSDPVRVEGEDLAAGSYGVHMIPGEELWTVIFSHNHTSWGSVTYDEKEDALRVAVEPEEAPFEESLRYGFENLGHDSATLFLSWAGLKVAVDLQVDTHGLVLAYIRRELRGRPRFFWEGWWSAAEYCFENHVNTAEALEWIDRSIAMDVNYDNTLLRFELLLQARRLVEAEEAFALATGLGTEVEINNLGYRFMARGDLDRAIETFLLNVTHYPESWNAHDSLAEAWENSGEKELALEYYTTALELLTDDSHRLRIEGKIEELSP